MSAAIQNVLGQATGGAIGPKLPVRKLGKNGPNVTALGYGCMGLSAFYGKPKPDPERFALLDKLYAEGELFWDSSDVYLDNEDLLGECLRRHLPESRARLTGVIPPGKWFESNPDKREHIFLASKFALRSDDQGNRWVDTTPEYCRQACEKSLSRLGVKHIDLYYAHRESQMRSR